MEYKAIVKFKDLKDNGHIYEPGDSFPRAGKKASPSRLAELSGEKNAAGRPLIEAIPEEETPEEAKPKKASKKTTKKGN